MVETKRKNLATVDVRSNNNTLELFLNNSADSDFHDEDDWIIVKKQKVNIMIPRLPNNELPIEPHPEQGQLHGPSRRMINTPESPKAQVGEKDDGSIHCSAKLNIHSSPIVLPPVDNAEPTIKPRKLDLRTLDVEKSKCPSEFCTSSKCIKPSIQSGLCGICNFSTFSMSVNNKIRALNLERNISSAGGLGRWLSSLGLERFERIFCAKNVGKIHLVNLSMEKLKDMGAHAVGPRRKLIHAIESVSQPYCHKSSKNVLHQLR